MDDPRLRALRIGVPFVGDDYANPPPVHALARRGIVDNVIGFSVYGDYRQDSPPQALLRAVDRGDIDVAIAWGPLAGAYARHSEQQLELEPLQPAQDGPFPFTFAIALGVRHADKALKDELEKALLARHDEVQALLTEFHFPLVE